MKKIALYFLRALVLLSFILPIIFQTVPSGDYNIQKEKYNIYTDINKELTSVDKNKIKNLIGDNKKVFNFSLYGIKNGTPLENYEDLLEKVNGSINKTIVVSDSRFFGDDSILFNKLLLKSKQNLEHRLFFIDENKLKNTQYPEKYLVLSDIFIPKISFLNEKTLLILSLIAKAEANTILQAEITLRSGDSFISSEKIKIPISSNGVAKISINIPVIFTKKGSQVITATLNSPYTKSPLNQASTTANVLYSKSSVLHLAVGPDWSLRTLRQKLRFWPNLDLMSYYILRSYMSDQSIPSHELSLIEFPAEKLFGDELQNFHGVIVQNFPLDSFLTSQELFALTEYVKNGGRLLIQAGPSSFNANNKDLNNIFPCENNPKWVIGKIEHWQIDPEQQIFNTRLSTALNGIQSTQNFLNCQPKKESIVLARTVESYSPILIVTPVSKGLVLSVLAGDWLYGGGKYFKNVNERMRYFDGIEELFGWVVEFLQRRQDGGLRAPELTGPRLYAQDKLLSIKNRDFTKQSLRYEIGSEKLNSKIQTHFASLSVFHKSILTLDHPLAEIIPTVTKQDSRNINERTHPITISLKDNKSESVKTFYWPIFTGSALYSENLPNPFLFKGIQTGNDLQKAKERDYKNIQLRTPLLEKYPYLLAVILALLALEQICSRILFRL